MSLFHGVLDTIEKKCFNIHFDLICILNKANGVYPLYETYQDFAVVLQKISLSEFLDEVIFLSSGHVLFNTRHKKYFNIHSDIICISNKANGENSLYKAYCKFVAMFQTISLSQYFAEVMLLSSGHCLLDTVKKNRFNIHFDFICISNNTNGVYALYEAYQNFAAILRKISLSEFFVEVVFLSSGHGLFDKRNKTHFNIHSDLICISNKANALNPLYKVYYIYAALLQKVSLSEFFDTVILLSSSYCLLDVFHKNRLKIHFDLICISNMTKFVYPLCESYQNFADVLQKISLSEFVLLAIFQWSCLGLLDTMQKEHFNIHFDLICISNKKNGIYLLL